MKLLCTHDDHQYAFEIPFEVWEMTFGQYLDTTQRDQEFLKASSETQMEKMIGVVAQVCKSSHKDGWAIIPTHIAGDENLEPGYQLRIGEELSIVRIYMHLVNMINDFHADPQTNTTEIEIEYKGDKYSIPSSRITLALTKPMYAGEFVEFLELERLTEEQRKRISEDRGDLLGNMEFKMNLKQMAVLLRKEGEELPWNKRERDLFIQKRAEYFQDLPLDVVLNIRAFFFRSMIEFIRSNSTSSSLKVRSKRARGVHQRADKSQKPSGN